MNPEPAPSSTTSASPMISLSASYTQVDDSIGTIFNHSISQNKREQYVYRNFSHYCIQRRTVAVRFAVPLHKMTTISSPLDQLETDKQFHSLWYSVDELNKMKDEIRSICGRARAQNFDSSASYQQEMQADDRIEYSITAPAAAIEDIPVSNGTKNHIKTSQMNKIPMMAIDSTTRGLESRICIERQRRRFKSIRYVVQLAQKNHLDIGHEKLAKFSMKLTRWATKLAIQEASRDYVRAYGSHSLQSLWNIRCMNHGDNDLENNDNIHKYIKKRSLEDMNGEGDLVRSSEGTTNKCTYVKPNMWLQKQ